MTCDYLDFRLDEELLDEENDDFEDELVDAREAAAALPADAAREAA